jgi:TRAP-type C4-dicarboxylate transport system permease small subunit
VKSDDDGIPDPVEGRGDGTFSIPTLNDGVPDEPRPLRVLAAIEVAVGVALFSLVFLGVMYQVVGRYFPAFSWVGAGEVALMSMITLTFITTGYLVGRNGHIVIQVFDRALAGSRLFVALRVVSAVIMTLTCLAVAYEAIVKIEVEWVRTSAAMSMPLGVLYVFALVGFLSAAAHSVFKIVYANRAERQLEISEMEV